MTHISDLAFQLLQAHRNGDTQLTRAAGSFCGELLTDPRPLTEKQADWLGKLLDRAGLPSIEEAAHG
jgi:hypothetical protein